MNLTPQPWMGQAEDTLLDSLMDDILAGGNFGTKDADRTRQIKYISNRDEHTVDGKSTIRQAWHTIGRKAKAEHKSRAAVVADYLRMLRKGQRKPDTVSTLKAADQRKKLYSGLGLFEGDVPADPENKVPQAGPMKDIYEALVVGFYHLCCPVWYIPAALHLRTDSRAERQAVIDQVTFIYKSFERQSMARRLYFNIQRYYPGARVIIADDSEEPLGFEGPQIIHLPFNSGLSKGIQSALDAVETPYTVRMDEDELLTPCTGWGHELNFLQHHPMVDLCAVNLRSPRLRSPEKLTQDYVMFTMDEAPKRLRITHGTEIGYEHIVFGKTPNTFLIATDKYRSIGYDENIRMIDHHEFFLRAAGNLVSCVNRKSFVFHYHNRFDPHYNYYRRDFQRDAQYIQMKHRKQ